MMSKKVKGNHFYRLTNCLHMTFQNKERIGLHKMKMKLQVATLLICVLLEVMIVRLASSSPVPDTANRQKNFYQHGNEKPEQKCPRLQYCTCIERNNKERTLDVTCNGVNSAKLRVIISITYPSCNYIVTLLKLYSK